LTDGILLADKPAGLTSFQALSAVKRALGTGRVGHTGPSTGSRAGCSS